MKDINGSIAVFGSAHPHVLQLAAMAQEAGFHVVGLYDDDLDRRDENAANLKIPAFAGVDALLAMRPQLALVGGVPRDRASMAAQCATAGVDVLVDKPLALTFDDLAELKRVTAATGRRVLVYYPYRGHPHLRAAKDAIARGDIGQLVFIETTGPHCLGTHERPAWHWERGSNGDVLIDLGAHGFDICHWFAGSELVDVAARTGNFISKAHPAFRDFGICTMRFSNGVIGKVEVDWLVPAVPGLIAETRFAMQGTLGRIDIRLAREAHAALVNETGMQPLLPAPGSMGDCTVDLLHALCTGKPCSIQQDEVWRASETSLRASAAAREEEVQL